MLLPLFLQICVLLLPLLLALLLLHQSFDCLGVVVPEVLLPDDVRFGSACLDLRRLDVLILLEKQVIRSRDMVVLVRVQASHHIVLLVVKIQRQELGIDFTQIVEVIGSSFIFGTWRGVTGGSLLFLAAEEIEDSGVDGNLGEADEDAAGDLLVGHELVPVVLSDVRYPVSLGRIGVQNL